MSRRRRPVLRNLVRGLGLALIGLITGCDSGGEYHRKGGLWHFDNRPMQVADPGSFQPLGRHFARDRLRGYYRESEVTGSEGASFEALSEHVARDARQVYWADTFRKAQEYWSIRHQRVDVIIGADPATFQVLRHDYGRDARAVFHRDQAFKVRDPESFEVLNASFTRDAQRAYADRVEIAGSDGASFELIDPDGRYARDRRQVFFTVPEVPRPGPDGRTPPAVQVLRGAHPTSFQLLGRGYARDGQRVWWAGQPLAGVDAASFAVEEDFTLPHDAHDAHARYLQGQTVGAPGSAAASGVVSAPVPR